MTEDEVDFEAGDKIIITSSTADMTQTEELIVLYTAGDGHTVVFTPPLQHDHVAQLYTFEGETIDMRVEVALLTRNIVIQGDENSARQQFGSHSLAAGGGKYDSNCLELYQVRCNH